MTSLDEKRQQLFDSVLKQPSLVKLDSLVLNRQGSSQNGSGFKTKSQDFYEKTLLVSKINVNDYCSLHKEEDFQLIKQLGRGSYGRVEKHLFKPLSQEVAKKEYFKKSDQEEFDTEVYILRTYKDDYIPKMIYSNYEKLYFYMELGMITLQDYSKYLKKENKRIEDSIAHWILVKLLELNHRLYKMEIHHSDIKPANIIITLNQSSEPILKFIDFGSASKYPQEYWRQYTEEFVNIELELIQGSNDLDRNQVFYAECFASCRSVQQLILSASNQFTQEFSRKSILSFLQNDSIAEQYQNTMPLLKQIFNNKSLSIDNSSFSNIQDFFNKSIDTNIFIEEFEKVYQFVNPE